MVSPSSPVNPSFNNLLTISVIRYICAGYNILCKNRIRKVKSVIFTNVNIGRFEGGGNKRNALRLLALATSMLQLIKGGKTVARAMPEYTRKRALTKNGIKTCRMNGKGS
jgi:hypothetical protein